MVYVNFLYFTAFNLITCIFLLPINRIPHYNLTTSLFLNRKILRFNFYSLTPNTSRFLKTNTLLLLHRWNSFTNLRCRWTIRQGKIVIHLFSFFWIYICVLMSRFWCFCIFSKYRSHIRWDWTKMTWRIVAVIRLQLGYVDDWVDPRWRREVEVVSDDSYAEANLKRTKITRRELLWYAVV